MYNHSLTTTPQGHKVPKDPCRSATASPYRDAELRIVTSVPESHHVLKPQPVAVGCVLRRQRNGQEHSELPHHVRVGRPRRYLR